MPNTAFTTLSRAGGVPMGASVTSGTISTFTAIGAGDVTINTKAMPAMAAAATAAARCDQLVGAINSMFTSTGVRACKVTATTFKLCASVAIVVAALAGTATLANCGLTAGTTAYSAGTMAASRKAFGSDVSGTDADVVKWGSMEIPVHHAKELGLMDYVAGADVYYF